jgi:hypothetical protein
MTGYEIMKCEMIVGYGITMGRRYKRVLFMKGGVTIPHMGIDWKLRFLG